VTTDPTTSTPNPDSTPASATTWAQDAAALLDYAGGDWAITRAHDDPLTLICERVRGSETHIVAGTPRVCLDRIAALPDAPPRPATVVRADAGAWITGMQE
jgi:hypothetical protein